jgi:hypothetical protein
MDISISTLFAPLNRFVGKYHPTIFFALIGLLLAGAIFMLYLILQIPSETSSTTPANTAISGTFDQATVKKIQQLRQSGESTTALVFPSPRSNPFVE